MKKIIKIAGAGLSGLTTGINLLKAGYKVIIYEEKENVGIKSDNEFQVIVNWMSDLDVIETLKRINIEINFSINPIKKSILFGPGLNKKVVFNPVKPIFYLIKRGIKEDCIDFSLKQQFIRQGGKIKFNTRANLENMDIIAIGSKKAQIMTIGYNFKTNFQDIVCNIIDNDLAPNVYAYLIIKNGQGTIASALSKDFKNREMYLQKTITAFQKKLGLVIKDKKKFQGFADFFLTKTAKKDGKLYVGEAAGFQDNLVGLGIFFALKSGHLAAKSIIEKLDYDKLWKKEFNNFLKISIINRFLFEFLVYKNFNKLIKLIKKHQENLLDLIKKGYKFDWKMKIIYIIAYLFMRKRVIRK